MRRRWDHDHGGCSVQAVKPITRKEAGREILGSGRDGKNNREKILEMAPKHSSVMKH